MTFDNVRIEILGEDEENSMVAYVNNNEDENGNEICEIWERKRREAVIQVVAYTTYLTSLVGIYQFRNLGRMTQSGSLEAYMVRERRLSELMNDLKVTRNCRGLIRMRPHAFEKFYKVLRDVGYLSDTRQASVEEQVAKFIYIVGHNARNFTLSLFFNVQERQLLEIFIECYAIIAMEDQFLKQPDGTNTPLEIQNDGRFYPYFKDCIGAIDGTHIRVKVVGAKAHRYIGRKGFPSQNVLAACTFDLKFIYVVAGWEGSSSDSRVVKNELYTREDKLKIPTGKYYLVDVGYMLKASLITPYRGVRDHLKEYTSHSPENSHELFNLRNSPLTQRH